MKLEGVRVLDLTQFLPGPHLTMTMADHGADVIKVEAPRGGDPGREIGLKQDGETVFFRNTNRGKRSVALDLKSESGQHTLQQLIDWADVLVESFRPGVADRLGFGADAVRARNPRIVYCSIAAFGQTGPYRDVPAHDLAIEALSGAVSVNVGSDHQPTMPGIPAADMAASLMALSAILMALLRRTTTGLGDRIDLSMHDALVAWLPNVLGPVFVEQRAPVPHHERTWGGSAFYHLYETADARHIVLGAQEIKFVRTLLGEFGRSDLVPLCEQGPGPHQQPVIEFLQSTFLTRTRAEWVDWFQGRDVSFAPVNNLLEAIDDPQVAARSMVLTDANSHRHLGVPIKFSDEPARPKLEIPSLDEHGAEVRLELARRVAASAVPTQS